MTLSQENKDLLKETIKRVSDNLQEIKDLQEDNNESMDTAAKKLDVPKPFLRKAIKVHQRSNLTEVEDECREIRDLLEAVK